MNITATHLDQPSDAPAAARQKQLQVGIAGHGYYLPDERITNHDLAKLVDTSDEWIVARTGIRSRHRASSSEATSDLATSAAKRALADARVGPADLDMIMLATATPDSPVPGTACFVQQRLGAINAAAMDINAGCSGFLYALDMADAYVRSGRHRRVLIIGAETLTRVTDYTDRRSCILFGDGAGAFVVADHGAFDLLYSATGCDGSEADLIQIPGGGSRQPATQATIDSRLHYLRLDGRRVFKQAVRRMSEAAGAALNATGLRPSDIDWLIPHQANERILVAVAEQLGLRPNSLILDVAETGNTSAASIPITMSKARDEGRFAPGHIIMLVAFGAGLTWACQILRVAR